MYLSHKIVSTLSSLILKVTPDPGSGFCPNIGAGVLKLHGPLLSRSSIDIVSVHCVTTTICCSVHGGCFSSNVCRKYCGVKYGGRCNSKCLSSSGSCWNPGTWVPQIEPITQGPIIGTEYIGTLIGSPSLIYGRGFTMAIISNNIRDMCMQSTHVQQLPWFHHGPN